MISGLIERLLGTVRWHGIVVIILATGPSYMISSPLPAVTLHNTNAGALDGFGDTVAVSGTHVVIATEHAGIVYVYNLASPTPTIPAVTLTNVGSSAAITGTRLVARARGTSVENQAVHVYELSTSTPTVPIFTLTNPAPSAMLKFFGAALAISGTRVVIGDSDNDSVPGGVAYLYDLASATPTVPALRFDNPRPTGGDRFGEAVAISGAKVVIGAPDDEGIPNTDNGVGIAYVYDLTSAAPATPLVTLTNSTPIEGDEFGGSVAIEGMRVVVGSEAETVFVFDLANPMPAHPILTFTNSTLNPREQFGEVVALSGSRLIVAAHRSDAAADDAGIVYVYDLTSATPTHPVAILNNPTAAEGDQFGRAVAVDGVNIIAGAPLDDADAEDGGIAYVFTVPPALRITGGVSGFVTISWTPAAGDFMLQHSDSLLPSDWLNAPSGSENPVTVQMTSQSKLYRLVAPGLTRR